MAQCPVCETELTRNETRGERYYFDCKRCGPYSLTYKAIHNLAWHLNRESDARLKLSYALYRMSNREQGVLVTSEMLENILANTELPLPQEQLENLILWMGETQPSIGEAIEIDEHALSAIGAADIGSLAFLATQAIELGLIKGKVDALAEGEYVISNTRLTLSGWKRHEELLRGKTDGHIAFMAMQFGDEELDNIYHNHFKLAVKQTGFSLRKADEGQPAGLIDDRMRIDIRRSRFLIADLTHQNRGAYWEAGYAEGLGKPVIYTCRKDVFEDKTSGTHFDTNHHLTVVWEKDNLADAVERLKATIRATMPEDAKLDDA